MEKVDTLLEQDFECYRTNSGAATLHDINCSIEWVRRVILKRPNSFTLIGKLVAIVDNWITESRLQIAEMPKDTYYIQHFRKIEGAQIFLAHI